MAKKLTTGERIELNHVRETLQRPHLDIDCFRVDAVYDRCRKSAKKIDAAIKRAFKRGQKSVATKEPANGDH